MTELWVPPGSDPTHIDITTDPHERRMRGIARHGNTPFDVPYISHISLGLYQGGCETGLVLPDTIDHLISLYPWERYTVHHELESELYVRMYDASDQGFEEVNRIARWVLACWQSGPTLVHCQAGLNRSSLIAARAMMLSGMTATEAVALIREQRSPAALCNRSFETWLLDIDKESE